MSDQPTRFTVIDGEGQPKPYRARKRGEAEPLVCPRCDGAATTDIMLGRMIRDGKPEGGTKAIVCVRCLAQGEVVKLV